MNLQLTKIELIEMLLNTKKPAVLEKVKAILEEAQDHLTPEDYAIIDARRAKHQQGESKSYTWDEVKASIQKS